MEQPARFPILVVLLASLALPAAARAGGSAPRTAVDLPALRMIDAALGSGELDLAQAISLRDLAVKRPWALEEPWRGRFARDPVSSWAATAVLIENQQWRMLSGLSPRRAPRAAYTFPAELPYHVDSEGFPIRMYYPSALYEGLANAVLHDAEISWQTEVDTWGFYAPPLVTEEGRYRIYIGVAGEGVSGYMDPFDTYGDVAWDACVSYVMIDEGNTATGVGPVVAHELNHAMQASMDCFEHLAFFENTSTFVMNPVFPGDGRIYQDGVLSAFQGAPYASVCRGDTGDLFMYGGFLWPHFLAYAYEDAANGPILVRRIWEGAMQETGSNTVDYMQSIDGLLRADYGSDLNTAFEQFTVARFFLDDLAGAPLGTIEGAASYSSTPPVVDTIFVGFTSSHSPPEGAQPEGYGADYWRLDAPDEFAPEVTVALDAEADGPWVLLLFSTDAAGVQRAEDAGGHAELQYTPTPGGEAILAVVRTAGAGFDPEDVPAAAAYTLPVGPAVPGPEIDAITPSAAAQGAAVDVSIDGANFQEGAQVTCTPEGIAVGAVSFVDDGALEVGFTAAADAPIGRYSITVTNPDGGSATLYSIFEITAPDADAGEPDGADDDGCGCTAAGAREPSPPSLLWLLSAAP